MKIAILANDTTYTYNLRGALLRRLLAAGHRVTVISQLRGFWPELEAMGCTLIGIDNDRHGKNPLQDGRLLLRYLSILRQEQPEAVLSFNIKPNIYGGMACRHLGIRFLPNVTGLGTALEYPGPLQALTCALYRIGVSRADCIFFQNRSNQDFFASRRLISPGTRSVLLPGSGVDLGAFSPLPYPWGDTVHFLFVSRILKEKGIDLYLHAARAIRRTHPEAVFHVCGCCDDPVYRAVMESAVQAGDIVYHGEQRDMRPFYEMACCVVHPSYYPEGMANVLLEAAACARPIITTDRSGCAETVEDGRTGLLIPIRDQDALTAALERFLSLPWEQRCDMGRLGREKMEREFDRAIVADRYMQVLFPQKTITKERQAIGL